MVSSSPGKCNSGVVADVDLVFQKVVLTRTLGRFWIVWCCSVEVEESEFDTALSLWMESIIECVDGAVRERA